jgi:hypothetical protein
MALCGLLSAMTLGCAPAKPATPAAAGKQSALDTARDLAKRAEALHAPVYRGPDDKGQKGEFLAGPLRQWVVARMKLHRRALAAYRDVVEQAPDAASRVVALDELGELELSLADEFVSAGVAAMPGEYRNDPQTAQAFKQALEGAVAPRVESARKAFKKCRSLARASKLSTPASARCSAKLAALPPPLPADALPAPQPRTRTPTLPVPERPLIASKQSTPCVLSGTLRTVAELDDARGRPLGVIDDSPGVELASLELPAEKGGALRVSLRWPVVVTGTLAAGALPLVSKQQLDLVKSHIWVGKGAALTAFHPAAGQAIAYRDFRDGKPHSKTQPAELSERIACSELALAQDTQPARADPQGKNVYLTGLVPLYAAPGKQQIGRIEVPGRIASRATLLERRGDFAHVRGEHGFSFDAWVQASALANPGLLGMLSSTPGRYTHVARAAIPLRRRPNSSAPVIATLAKGAYVRIGPLYSGFVPVRIAGLVARNRSRAFYVDARDLPELAPGKHSH